MIPLDPFLMPVRNRVAGAVLAVVLLVTSMPGCDEPAAPASQSFEFHIQSFFQGDWVRLELDDRPVFWGRATTEPLLGVAAVIPSSATPGAHVARVTVGGVERTVQFDLRSPLYILVQLDPQGPQPAITVTSVRPLYD